MKPIEIQPRRNALRVVLVVVTVAPVIVVWAPGPVPGSAEGGIGVTLVALHPIIRPIPVLGAVCRPADRAHAARPTAVAGDRR